jgi:serine/threonine-protein kinase
MNRIFALVAAGLLIATAGSATAQSAPAAQDSYGAIAAAKENIATGYSINQPSQDQADQLAMNECASNSEGKPCQVRVHFKNACGAIADSANGRAGFSWGTIPEKAEQEALVACAQVGPDCRIAATFCSNRRPATRK